ncbi:hypothetical protein Cgig2_026356 [Carnegiea gigantea]|uniref:Uncharacterized protein n=1 Tax=Carnegiea gigantea TaxID=171969 RepID=A0A9Q1QIJ3_9CARY|nr:hypothetical protein Cgig2_026356 [Carnegiea gigantea]
MDSDDNMATEPSPSPSPWPPPSAAKLTQILDQATKMAKQLPTTAGNSDHHRLILSSIHAAQVSLSNFLSLHHYPPPSGNSSSAGADELMMEDDGVAEAEEDSKNSSMERVEEKMRESLYIQNKRPKRPLSPLPAAVAERWGLEERENGSVRVPAGFDPHRISFKKTEKAT